MNFLESGPGGKGLRCITVIKFRDNVRFSLDAESIREEIVAQHGKEIDLRALKGKGAIIELASGVRQEVMFILSLHGVFKQQIEGQVWLPEGTVVKQFDQFVKSKPYILTFRYEAMEKFEFRRSR